MLTLTKRTLQRVFATALLTLIAALYLTISTHAQAQITVKVSSETGSKIGKPGFDIAMDLSVVGDKANDDILFNFSKKNFTITDRSGKAIKLATQNKKKINSKICRKKKKSLLICLYSLKNSSLKFSGLPIFNAYYYLKVDTGDGSNKFTFNSKKGNKEEVYGLEVKSGKGDDTIDASSIKYPNIDFYSSEGSDTVEGGAGDDSFAFGKSLGNTNFNGGKGKDTVEARNVKKATHFNASLKTGTYDLGTDKESVKGSLKNVENLRATSGSYSLEGDDKDNLLSGASPSTPPSTNKILGNGGNDTIESYKDSYKISTLDGGSGTDKVVLGTYDDTSYKIDFTSGQGVSSAGSSYTNFEDLTVQSKVEVIDNGTLQSITTSDEDDTVTADLSKTAVNVGAGKDTVNGIIEPKLTLPYGDSYTKYEFYTDLLEKIKLSDFKTGEGASLDDISCEGCATTPVNLVIPSMKSELNANGHIHTFNYLSQNIPLTTDSSYSLRFKVDTASREYKRLISTLKSQSSVTVYNDKYTVKIKSPDDRIQWDTMNWEDESNLKH